MSAMHNNQMPGQPIQNGGHGGAPQEWKTGLFGCFSDMGSCLMTCCCPCVQYGQNYEAMNGEGCFAQGAIFAVLAYCGLSCCIHKDFRAGLRNKYNLDEGCGDCLTTCFCAPCAICQEAREIKGRK